MKKTFLSLFLLTISIVSNAQLWHYQYIKTIAATSEDVTFQLLVYCDSKKELNYAAYLAGIRCVMFDGIPESRFSKPLLSEGEVTSIENKPIYFDDLYGRRYTDYIKNCMMLSRFKKSGDGQSTLFEITVRASMLRRDLEKHNVRTKFGL